MSSPRRVINGKGPATVLGGAIVADEVAVAAAEAMRSSVHMGELQWSAGTEIAQAIGAEAALVTGCAAAGMSISVAAAIAGSDMTQVTSLPLPRHERHDIVLQKAHMIVVGGCDVNQVIRLGGGRPVEVGTAADCADFHLAAGLSERTAAGLFVEGERAHGSGTLSLREFARQCHASEVPVIVDAAGTIDPSRHIEEGADLVVFSVHKWLRGPTAGVVAGQRDLVEAAFMHAEFGIGRPMKVGKEGVAGAQAAVRLWAAGAHQHRIGAEQRLVESIVEGLQDLQGITARRATTIHESTSLDSVRIDVDASEAGITAWQLAATTEAMDPSVTLYDYEAAQGYLLIDPGFLSPEDATEIVEAIRTVLARAATHPFDPNAPTPPRFATLTRTMAAWSRAEP